MKLQLKPNPNFRRRLNRIALWWMRLKLRKNTSTTASTVMAGPVRKHKVRPQLVVEKKKKTLKHLHQKKKCIFFFLRFTCISSCRRQPRHAGGGPLPSQSPAAPCKRDELSPVEKAPGTICLAERLSELSQRRSVRSNPLTLCSKLEGEETEQWRGETHFIATSHSR